MNEPAETQAATTKRSSLPILLALLAVAAIVAIALLVIGMRQRQAEETARQTLSDMGAIIQRGATSKRVETLTMNTPTAKDRVAEAMPHIANLRALTHLDLARTNVTDDQLKTVGKLPNLNSLVLNETGITDAGFKHVAGLQLQALQLKETKISSSSMDLIGKMTLLKNLDLSHTDVAGNLAPLENLSEVNWIVLSGIELDEEAIDILCKMPNLKQLSIIGTNLSDELTDRLKAEKPTITIDRQMRGEANEFYGEQ